VSPIVYTYTVYAFDNERHTRHDRHIVVREKNGKEGERSREPNSVCKGEECQGGGTIT
jgi:hypothetical protein